MLERWARQQEGAEADYDQEVHGYAERQEALEDSIGCLHQPWHSLAYHVGSGHGADRGQETPEARDSQAEENEGKT